MRATGVELALAQLALVAAGLVQPIVHGTMPLEEARAAHELMESGSHSGKILLTVAR